MKNINILYTIILAGPALAACSMQPEKNVTLDDARSDYSVAQSNPNVNKLAAIELQQAGKALDEANVAQKKNEDRALVDHLAYLAKQRVAIAQETTKLKEANIAIANAGNNREEVLLEARAAEADVATKKAAAAQQKTTLIKNELAVAKANAENANLSLEIQKADADAVAEQQAQVNQESANQKADELAAANTKIAQMQVELVALNAKQTQRGLVITLSDVLFNTNKANLRSIGNNNLQKLADFFNEYPRRTALIEGFTDSTGNSDYNQGLSDRRANAVRNALISLGISGERVSTRGLGEADPVASNDTSAGRQLNRRVEIILSDEKGNIEPQ